MVPVIGFTLLQATLSAVLGTTGGAFLALALLRCPSEAVSRWSLTLCSAVQSLPAIIVVLVVVSVFGTKGLFPSFPLHGLGGILAAHSFFFIPLSALLFYERLSSVGPLTYRLAMHLGLRGWSHIEGPILKKETLKIFLYIFFLALNSFSILLMLGGRAPTPTLSVALYQTITYDFDKERLIIFLLIQAFVGGLSGLFMVLRPLNQERQRLFTSPFSSKKAQIIALLFLFLWCGSTIWGLWPGIGSIPFLLQDLSFLRSSLITLGLSFTLGGLSCGIALLLIHLALSRWALFILFLLPAPLLGVILWWLSYEGVEPWVLFIGGQLLALLPYSLMILMTTTTTLQAQYQPLRNLLGLSGFKGWYHSLWPSLQKPFLWSFLLTSLLCCGDLRLLVFIPQENIRTLGLDLFDALTYGSLEDAKAIALFLLLLHLIFLGRSHAPLQKSAL